MAGCWVALLFSLVDPYLWIFSSRHRHIHATDSAQKAIQGSIREDPRVSAARLAIVLRVHAAVPSPPHSFGCPPAAGPGHRAAYA